MPWSKLSIGGTYQFLPTKCGIQYALKHLEDCSAQFPSKSSQSEAYNANTVMTDYNFCDTPDKGAFIKSLKLFFRRREIKTTKL
jgi:hypothetical protein